MKFETLLPPSSPVAQPLHPRLPWEPRYRHVASSLLGVQFLVMLFFVTDRFNHFVGTKDETTVFQAMYQIAHGNLNPYSQTTGFHWIQNHGAFAMWLLAPLDRLGPPGLAVLWLQVLAVTATAYVTLRWVLTFLRAAAVAGLSQRRLKTLAGLAIGILIVAPWSYWSVGYDIHIEVLTAPFIMAATLDFSVGRRRRAWIWVAITLAFGDVSSTWLVGIALSAIIAGLFEPSLRRRNFSLAVLLSVVGVGWSAGMALLGFAKGSTFTSNFGYLTVPIGHPLPQHIGFSRLLRASFRHPIRFVKEIAHHWINLYANTAPYGIIGIATTWTLGVPAVILIENNLTPGYLFNEPSFQTFPAYGFLLVGTVMVLATLTRRWASRTLFVTLVSAVAASTLAWAIVFLPQLTTRWIAVSTPQAAALAADLARIPEDAPVAVSSGVGGRFANRHTVYLLSPHLRVRNLNQPLWIIDAPDLNATNPRPRYDAMFATLLDTPGVTLLDYHHQVAFFLFTPSHTHPTYHLHNLRAQVPVWTIPGAHGSVIRQGSARNWFVRADGHGGPLIDGPLFALERGHYTLAVRLRSGAPVTIAVDNPATHQVLLQRTIPASVTPRTTTFPVTVSRITRGQQFFAGVTPFIIQSHQNAARNRLHLVLRIGAGATGDVFAVSLYASTP
jgi:hypothetical protein